MAEIHTVKYNQKKSTFLNTMIVYDLGVQYTHTHIHMYVYIYTHSCIKIMLYYKRYIIKVMLLHKMVVVENATYSNIAYLSPTWKRLQTGELDFWCSDFNASVCALDCHMCLVHEWLPWTNFNGPWQPRKWLDLSFCLDLTVCLHQWGKVRYLFCLSWVPGVTFTLVSLI